MIEKGDVMRILFIALLLLLLSCEERHNCVTYNVYQGGNFIHTACKCGYVHSSFPSEGSYFQYIEDRKSVV